MPTEYEIHDRFAHHPPKGDAVELHEEIRAKFIALAIRLNEMLPDSREKSKALTELQNAAMWANATVAIHISGSLEKTCPNCLGSGNHYEGTDGVTGSGHYTCTRKPDPLWETNLRVERAQQMLKDDPAAHVLVLTPQGWTIMHSAACAKDGSTVNCAYTRAAARTNFVGWPSPVKLRLLFDDGQQPYLANGGT